MKRLLALLVLAWSGTLPGGNAVAAGELPAFEIVVRDGVFTPRVHLFDTATDVVRWTPNPAVTAIPAATTVRIDSIRVRIATGEFRVPAPATP